jgi:hypothetical protein
VFFVLVNASMSDPDRIAGTAPRPGGRLPTAAQAAILRSQVAALWRVFDDARTDAHLLGSAANARLIEKYRDGFQEAMRALSGTLADFLDESAQPVDFETLRTEFLEPILSLSRSLPAFRRTEDWAQGKGETPELQRLVLEPRPAAFDLQTALLAEFYHNTAAPRSFRARAEALASLFDAEVERHRSAESGPLRILVLGAGSVLNLHSQFGSGLSESHTFMLVVDSDTQALRHARLQVGEHLKLRPTAYRATPASYVKNASAPAGLFDIAYALMLFDALSFESALEFTRDLSTLLRPGGTLLTGGYLPTLSRLDRALATAFTGLSWCYWDEAMWKQMLADLPFDLAESQFRVVAPDALTVLARRS